MIARVFPRKTAASPNDELAFFGVPTIDAIATCILSAYPSRLEGQHLTTGWARHSGRIYLLLCTN